MSIVVLGSINLDLTTYVPRLPRPGETLKGHSFMTAPGGKGANQAVAAARLGARVCLVGRVGDDAFGRDSLEPVAGQGVDVGAVIRDKANPTGLALISVDDQGENAITVISGANMALDQSDLERCRAVMKEAGVILFQREIPLEISRQAASAARERGMTVIFDPAPAGSLPEDFYGEIDVLTPNQGETESLVGFRPKNEKEAALAAHELHRRGLDTAVIKLGERGVLWSGKGGTGYLEPFKVKAKDSVAAGDAFNGALAAALDLGLGLEEAVRWGSAAGAISATRAGAQPSLPDLTELEAMLNRG